ncbi:HTH-type transcriptional regulator LutR [Pleomorphomonas sp. SM30]|uniref:DNA-binding FadR family transcriptional regulator n=2 Tax=Oharaeibacter diazotrophicus TaxID=1920512 RepID=A0A4R6RC33_9HYPH|nr:DNA-binding FadR family transcriptional regulator [Oharaeibacter diazotrophicus]BBE72398.1 HTH-type transcriptional regulator LutR [Pleomorphomonas sp. SM30]
MYISQDHMSGKVRRNLHEQIAHDIGTQIVQGTYGETDLLPTELTLAERYRVSRTAVREAFRILAAKGMTVSRPKIGTRVRMRVDWNMLDPDVLTWHLRQGATADFVEAVFEVRFCMEPEVAGIAAERRTDRHLRAMAAALQTMQKASATRDTLVSADIAFLQAMLDASGNPIYRSIGTVTESLIRFLEGACLPADRRNAGDAAVTGVNPATRRHAAVYAAIRDRDGLRAREEVRGMVAAAREACLAAATGAAAVTERPALSA